MRPEKLTEEQQEEIIKLYLSGVGSTTIGNQFGTTDTSILDFLRRKGIEIRQRAVRSIDAKIFIDSFTPVSSYLLGFFWADAYLDKNGYIKLGLVSEDAEEIRNEITSTGNWLARKRQQKGRREQIEFISRDKELEKYLVDVGFRDRKFGVSPCKLIKDIPKELQHYWFRGYTDGDGCFYLGKKLAARQVSFGAVYSQNWAFMEKLSHLIGMNKTKVERFHTKSGSFSYFRFCNKNDIGRFGSYIYAGDQIGLKRKRDKFEAIMNSYS